MPIHYNRPRFDSDNCLVSVVTYVITGTIHYLAKLVPEMTCNVSSGTLSLYTLTNGDIVFMMLSWVPMMRGYALIAVSTSRMLSRLSVSGRFRRSSSFNSSDSNRSIFLHCLTSTLLLTAASFRQQQFKP